VVIYDYEIRGDPVDFFKTGKRLEKVIDRCPWKFLENGTFHQLEMCIFIFDNNQI